MQVENKSVRVFVIKILIFFIKNNSLHVFQKSILYKKKNY